MTSEVRFKLKFGQKAAKFTKKRHRRFKKKLVFKLVLEIRGRKKLKKLGKTEKPRTN